MPQVGIPAKNSSWAWNFTKLFFTFAGGPGNVPTCAGQALRQNVRRVGRRGRNFIVVFPSLGSSSLSVHGHELGHLMTSHVQRIECTRFTATRDRSDVVVVFSY